MDAGLEASKAPVEAPCPPFLWKSSWGRNSGNGYDLKSGGGGCWIRSIESTCGSTLSTFPVEIDDDNKGRNSGNGLAEEIPKMEETPEMVKGGNLWKETSKNETVVQFGFDLDSEAVDARLEASKAPVEAPCPPFLWKSSYNQNKD